MISKININNAEIVYIKDMVYILENGRIVDVINKDLFSFMIKILRRKKL